MGDFEAFALASVESPLKYHPKKLSVLTRDNTTCPGTMSGGQFDWGGRLLKSNGGARRSAQPELKPGVECKRISGLDCEANTPSRYESRC